MPKMRTFAELRDLLIAQTSKYLLESESIADADFEACVQRASDEIAQEIQVEWAQATATLLKEHGIKPQ